MSDENPYRYEGTAESLHRRPGPPPMKHGKLSFAGVFAAIAATFTGAIAASLIHAEAVSGALFLTMFVLLPIVIYCVRFAFTHNQKASLIAFGIAAAPLGFLFLLIIIQGGIGREIGIMVTINYGVQLVAAGLTLLFAT